MPLAVICSSTKVDAGGIFCAILAQAAGQVRIPQLPRSPYGPAIWKMAGSSYVRAHRWVVDIRVGRSPQAGLKCQIRSSGDGQHFAGTHGKSAGIPPAKLADCCFQLRCDAAGFFSKKSAGILTSFQLKRFSMRLFPALSLCFSSNNFFFENIITYYVGVISCIMIITWVASHILSRKVIPIQRHPIPASSPHLTSGACQRWLPLSQCRSKCCCSASFPGRLSIRIG